MRTASIRLEASATPRLMAAASPPPVVAAGLAGADDAAAAWVCEAAGLLADSGARAVALDPDLDELARPLAVASDVAGEVEAEVTERGTEAAQIMDMVIDGREEPPATLYKTIQDLLG